MPPPTSKLFGRLSVVAPSALAHRRVVRSKPTLRTTPAATTTAALPLTVIGREMCSQSEERKGNRKMGAESTKFLQRLTARQYVSRHSKKTASNNVARWAA